MACLGPTRELAGPVSSGVGRLALFPSASPHAAAVVSETACRHPALPPPCPSPASHARGGRTRIVGSVRGARRLNCCLPLVLRSVRASPRAFVLFEQDAIGTRWEPDGG